MSGPETPRALTDPERETRLDVLRLAASTFQPGARADEIVAAAEAMLAFVEGRAERGIDGGVQEYALKRLEEMGVGTRRRPSEPPEEPQEHPQVPRTPRGQGGGHEA